MSVLASLILADADWSYLVALIIISVVSGVASWVKQRAQKRAAQADGGQAETHQEDDWEADDEDDYAEVEAMPAEPPPLAGYGRAPASDRPSLPVARPTAAPPPLVPKRTAAPPVAVPFGEATAQPAAPPVAWTTREAASRAVLVASPLSRINVREASDAFSMERIGGTTDPFVGRQPRSDRTYPPDARVFSKVRAAGEAQAGTVVTAAPSDLQRALRNRLLQGPPSALREAILIAEILGRPVGLRDVPTGSGSTLC